MQYNKHVGTYHYSTSICCRLTVHLAFDLFIYVFYYYIILMKYLYKVVLILQFFN